MQFLENKKWLGLMLLIIFMTTATIAQKSSKIGYWLGSMGYVDKLEGFIPTPAFQINLSSKGKKKVIISDENGDFMFLELPIGKYCVVSIQDKDGKVFQIDSNQSKCFEIKKKQTTRFDIIVVKNDSKP